MPGRIGKKCITQTEQVGSWEWKEPGKVNRVVSVKSINTLGEKKRVEKIAEKSVFVC